MTLLWLTFFTAVIITTNAEPSPVALNSNGYEGVVVAIGDRVTENPRLLDEIKSVFSSASEQLFKATGRRASFRNITVIVPQSWSQQADYEPATTETFDKANVIVDVTAWEDEQSPYTQQAGGCGQQGEFIHLTPYFLLNATETQRNYGHRGKAIVHEWGHLRWGLFDEYPVSDNVAEHFYVDSNGNVQPTRCSAKIQGTIKDSFGRVCSTVDKHTSLYSSSCRFYPSDTSETKGASYMYQSSLSEVTAFCDSAYGTDESHRHNSEAPNLQNKLCFGKSAWDVMREHRDFAYEANPPVPENEGYSTNVTFRIVQRGRYVAVVVMDISGSMSSNNNHVKLDVAVKNFLTFVVPDGSLIGLVYFSSRASLLTYEMTLINNTLSRERLVRLMSPSATSGTSIGAGMAAGLQLLRSNNQNPAGSFMIVISDGEENEYPYISSVLPEVVAAGVIIDTLLFTRAADTQLLRMATETGGLAFFYSGIDDYTNLLDGLTSTVTSRLRQDSTSRAIMVASRSTSVPGRTSVVQRVIIDGDLGRDTRFTFTWSVSSSSFLMSLTSPNGTRYDYAAASSSYVQNIVFSSFVQSGYWIVNITNTGLQNATVVMQVDSKPIPGIVVAPILVHVSSSAERQFAGLTQPMTVYAKVSKDYKAVTGASVWATLESPFGVKTVFQLRDSGSGSDNIKDDGIYSGYILRVSETGNYAVSVRVEGTNETAVTTATTGNRASPVADFKNVKKRSIATKDPTGAFERVASGDILNVTTLPQTADRYPPSRIQDLRIAAASYETGEVTLEFTAVGDDYDDGRAHHYILRRSDNYTALFTNFQNSTIVPQQDVISGNLTSPAYANQMEKLVVKVDIASYTAFSIIAVDAVGHESPPSNIVGTRPILPLSIVADDSALKIGLSVGVGSLVIIIVVVVIVACKRRHSK